MSEKEAPAAPPPAAEPAKKPDPPEPPPEGEPAAAPAPEGEEQAAAATEPAEEINANKLGSWSKKLSHKQARLNAREGRLADRERAIQEREQRAAQVEQLLETDPRQLLDKLAERRGMTRSKVYEQWMQDELRAGTPDEKLAKLEAEMQRDREERKKQAEAEAQQRQQATVQAFQRDVHNYVGNTLASSAYDFLKPYPAQQVASKAFSIIIGEIQRTGQEPPLDEVLRRMNNATKAEVELHQRQREAENPTPSQQNGAVQSAQPASRKRAITNAIAASKATPDDDDDDISDAALKRRSAEALRRSGTGWR